MSEARWKRKWKATQDELNAERKFSHTAVTALSAAAARIKYLEAEVERLTPKPPAEPQPQGEWQAGKWVPISLPGEGNAQENP